MYFLNHINHTDLRGLLYPNVMLPVKKKRKKGKKGEGKSSVRHAYVAQRARQYQSGRVRLQRQFVKLNHADELGLLCVPMGIELSCHLSSTMRLEDRFVVHEVHSDPCACSIC